MQFWQQCRKIDVKNKLLSALSPKLVFTRALIFFKMILRTGRMECTSDEHAELFFHDPTLFRVKSKYYEKAFTLFSGQLIFHQTVSLHVKHIFDNSARKFWAEHGRKFNLKYRIWWENLTLLKKYQNCALELENAVMSTV